MLNSDTDPPRDLEWFSTVSRNLPISRTSPAAGLNLLSSERPLTSRDAHDFHFIHVPIHTKHDILAKAVSLISFQSTELCSGGENTAAWQIVTVKLSQGTTRNTGGGHAAAYSHTANEGRLV